MFLMIETYGSASGSESDPDLRTPIEPVAIKTHCQHASTAAMAMYGDPHEALLGYGRRQNQGLTAMCSCKAFSADRCASAGLSLTHSNCALHRMHTSIVHHHVAQLASVAIMSCTVTKLSFFGCAHEAWGRSITFHVPDIMVARFLPWDVSCQEIRGLWATAHSYTLADWDG